MSLHPRAGEKRRALEEVQFTEEDMLDDSVLSSGDPMSPKQLDQEKRLRREIANSNERRRMQSINAGFQSLKTLLPHRDGGEKLSKAAILQQTSDYISSLERDKTRLLSQNANLKAMLRDLGSGSAVDCDLSPSPTKRKKRDTESSDEGIGLACGDGGDELTCEAMKREMIELRLQLDRERQRRLHLEGQARCQDSDVSPDRLRQLTDHVTDTMIKKEAKQREESDADAERLKSDEVKVEVKASVKTSPCAPVTVTRVTPAPQSQPPHRHSPFLNSYLSRRNLETIVEAIRHLEGDNMLHDRNPDAVVKATSGCRRLAHSEESGTESSYDLEDSKSDSSGRDSPSPTPGRSDEAMEWAVGPPRRQYPDLRDEEEDMEPKNGMDLTIGGAQRRTAAAAAAELRGDTLVCAVADNYPSTLLAASRSPASYHSPAAAARSPVSYPITPAAASSGKSMRESYPAPAAACLGLSSTLLPPVAAVAVAAVAPAALHLPAMRPGVIVPAS